VVDVTNPAAVHKLLQLPPNLVVYRVEVRTVGCHRAGAMKSDVRVQLHGLTLTASTQRHFRTSDCSKALYWKSRYFVIDI